MTKVLPPETIYKFTVSDFESLWNCLAADSEAEGRGNFIFALHAMILLEFAARLCRGDQSGQAIIDFSRKLCAIEPKYFTELPGDCYFCPREFDLPSVRTHRERQLLWAIFDLVRNGQAHQYQQISVNLSDNHQFRLSLGGAQPGLDLRTLSEPQNKGIHLLYRVQDNVENLGQKELWMAVSPGQLFLDFKTAIDTTHLLERGIQFTYLERPRTRAGPRNRPVTINPPRALYHFNLPELKHCLSAADHQMF